ncbi:MAG: 2-oxo acid dehydrogenase subunit E2 [Clostridiales bacterium]|nr:2-oxo acid dehydrogenase subunit E2 [Clostridiales bacterium]
MVEIFMPKAGMDMKEGHLIRWLKNVGDPVELDEPIMEIETDKITMEAEAPGTGILLAKLIEDGTTVPVLQTIGYIGQPGEKVPDNIPVVQAEVSLDVAEAVDSTPSVASLVTSAVNGVPATPYAKKMADERGIDLASVPRHPGLPVFGKDVASALSQNHQSAATPLARKYAQAKGVDIQEVSGSGVGGKIRKEDVLAAAQSSNRIPLTPIRKAIARNMYNSLQSMAQTSDSVEIDVTELVALRKRLVERQELLGTRITVNDLLSYAAVKMLRTHPLANASLDGDEIITYPYVNLGIAVATDYGLTSPVIHGADCMSLVEMSKAVREMVTRARERRLAASDQQDATFTLTNMGVFPVDNFNPILPAPQSCIVGFGRCVEKPAVHDGEICIRVRMVLSVTYDHRVFDGGEVGSIMATLKEYLETPELFLVQ